MINVRAQGRKKVMLDVVEERQKIVLGGLIRPLHITPRAFLPMRKMPEIQLIAGQGIPDDRYIGRRLFAQA
jgi:hypothetical protein